MSSSLVSEECETLQSRIGIAKIRKSDLVRSHWPKWICLLVIGTLAFAYDERQLRRIKQVSAFNLNPANGIHVSVDATKALEQLSPFHNINPDGYLEPTEFIRSRHFVPEVHHVLTKDNYILTMHRIINPLVPLHLRSRLKPVLVQHGLFTSSSTFIINSDINTDRPRFDPRDLTRTWPLHIYNPLLPPFSWWRIIEMIKELALSKHDIKYKSTIESLESLQDQKMSDSLAFELANQGYDVWMSNSRGSTYSLGHTHYDYRYDWRYWDFSFHEIGLYDLPAQINYILARRKRQSLAYIGHSQGNLAMFILQSFQPQWAHKVKPFIAMAPVAFVPNVYYGALRFIVKSMSPFVTLTSLNRVLKGQILPKSQATSQALDLICLPKRTTRICDIMLALLLGSNLKRANESLTPIIAHNIPEGTSMLNVLHFAQMAETGEFRSFDFGPSENLHRYGNAVNPYYPIKNIKSPDIALVYGRSDTLATMSNVRITRSMLNVTLLDDYLVPDISWGHADYMYANGAGRLANSHMIGLVDRYRLVP